VSFAQEEKTSNNELKLNVGYALGEIPEVSYEYLLSEDAAIGTSILFAITDDTDLKFALTPYYRFYFGKKRAAGFFAETFGMINITEDDFISYAYDSPPYPGYSYERNPKNETGFALGIAIGAKFLSKNNWVFEIYGGVGRNLINNDNYDSVPRFGLTLGKRF
jgi:hypothetical protein